MDYAQVSAAVITQEYIDGLQNDYLAEVQEKYPERFLCCGMVDMRKPGYLRHAEQLITQGFRAMKIPANRLITDKGKIPLTGKEAMQMFKLMENNRIILSIDLYDGAEQTSEMKEIIAECPALKIAIGHFGMVTRKDWQEQIKLARNENVMIESGGITWLFNDEFYPFTGAVWAIKEAITLVGAEKLMWGSDYPRTITAITYRMSCDFILKSGLLADDEKSLLLGRNAKTFYGFGNLPELPYIKNMSE
jgi:predicted TIM-barrel fold metal-dependent hydrolase